MSLIPYKTVKLTAANQFGPDGPQPGAIGTTYGEPFLDEDEVWYHVWFGGFRGHYNVREDMAEFARGY